MFMPPRRRPWRVALCRNRAFRPRLERLEDRTLLSAGDLDPAFGAGGKVLAGFRDSLEDTPSAVVRQPDGKYVVAGVSEAYPRPMSGLEGTPVPQLSLARYNADGSLDASFGTGGRVVAAVVGSAADLALQADGKLVVTGTVGPTARATGTTSTAQDVLVARFTAAGALDPTFGTGGVVTSDFGGADTGRKVLVQPDGKIVVTASRLTAGVLTANARADAVLARYNPNGSVDQGFGESLQNMRSGRFVVPDERNPVPALLPDGKILVSLTQNVVFALRRFTPDGLPDTSFGMQGLVTAFIGGLGDTDEARAMAVQPDGKVVVAGLVRGAFNPITHSTPPPRVALARFNPDGSFDTTFGGGGQAFIGTSDLPYGLAIQADGGIVVAATFHDGSTSAAQGGLIRVLANGTLDPAFGTGGRVTTGFSKLEEFPAGLALDGTSIVASGTVDARTQEFGLVRFLPTGTLDPTFGTSGRVSTDLVGPVNSEANGAARQPDGKLVVAGTSSNRFVSSFAVARFNPDGGLDATFGAGGQVLLTFSANGNDEAHAVAVQPDGKLLVAGVAGGPAGFPNQSSPILVRLNADGSLDTSFGTGGRVTRDVAPFAFNEFKDVLAQPDGKILVGLAALPSLDRPVLRLNPDGTLDQAFQGNPTRAANALALQADGRVVLAGLDGSPNPNFTVDRYTPDGRPDAGFGSNGRAPDPGPRAADRAAGPAVRGHRRGAAAGRPGRRRGLGR
jgi:uncharacterized delta-60 repeat protein